MNAPLFEALKLEKLAMGVILLLIVIVAAFNIVSTLVMVVTDKTREIGILKSMGLRGSQVQRVFMLQGLVIGLVGTTIGATLALALCWVLDTYRLVRIPMDVYQITYIPFVVRPVDFVVVVVSAVVICFLATIYPSRQAARLDPVQALRFE
jgi:lipoprotein-releasing system permease protein